MPAGTWNKGVPRAPRIGLHRRSLLVLSSCLTLASFLCDVPERLHAETRVVTGEGLHRLSDRETKDEGTRLAAERAKRQALEQVATYLESVTVVKNLDVTQDELRSYTAGLVLVLDQQTKMLLEGDVVVIKVILTAQVDTEEVQRAIATLRQNEDARQELLALHQELEQLHQDLDQANRALAAATSIEQARTLSRQREDLLNRTQSDAMVAQAWTDWALLIPLMTPSPATGLAQVQAMLAVAAHLNPSNSRVAFAQEVISTKTPPAPPQPPRPPVPSNIVTVPGTASQPGTEPSDHAQGNSRQLSSVYQLNPLLPNPTGQPPTAGSSVTIIQVPAQSGTAQQRPGGLLDRMYQQTPGPAGRLNQPATLHTIQPGHPGNSATGQPLPPGGQQFHSPMPHQGHRLPAQAPAAAPPSVPSQGQSTGVK